MFGIDEKKARTKVRRKNYILGVATPEASATRKVLSPRGGTAKNCIGTLEEAPNVAIKSAQELPSLISKYAPTALTSPC